MTMAQQTGSASLFGLPWKDNARELLIPLHRPAASPFFRFKVTAALVTLYMRRCDNAPKLEAFWSMVGISGLQLTSARPNRLGSWVFLGVGDNCAAVNSFSGIQDCSARKW